MPQVYCTALGSIQYDLHCMYAIGLGHFFLQRRMQVCRTDVCQASSLRFEAGLGPEMSPLAD
jgi:hypothetical protein